MEGGWRVDGGWMEGGWIKSVFFFKKMLLDLKHSLVFHSILCYIQFVCRLIFTLMFLESLFRLFL